MGCEHAPEPAEIWGTWGRLTKAAFKAATRADLDDTEKIRQILDRARKELEALWRRPAAPRAGDPPGRPLP